MGVVTVSASYGAGGSEIGPAVAAALGLPFVDRAVPVGVARKLDVPLDQAERRDETTDRGLWRVISSMAAFADISFFAMVTRLGSTSRSVSIRRIMTVRRR